MPVLIYLKTVKNVIKNIEKFVIKRNIYKGQCVDIVKSITYVWAVVCGLFERSNKGKY